MHAAVPRLEDQAWRVPSEGRGLPIGPSRGIRPRAIAPAVPSRRPDPKKTKSRSTRGSQRLAFRTAEDEVVGLDPSQGIGLVSGTASGGLDLRDALPCLLGVEHHGEDTIEAGQGEGQGKAQTSTKGQGEGGPRPAPPFDDPGHPQPAS